MLLTLFFKKKVMRKNFAKTKFGVVAAAFLMAQSAMAQDIPALNSSDFTKPAWTRLNRVLATLQSSTMPYSINMTVNGDPSTRMAFAWFTNPDVTEGEVQIVAKADATVDDFASPAMVIKANPTDVRGLNYSTAKNKLEGIEPNTKADYCSHKAIATGLTPATTYSFRVGNANGWSEIGSFTTASSDKNEQYSFIYITDTQAQYDEMFDVSQKTVHAAYRMVPDAAFVLCNGDLVETSGSSNSEWEYEQWFSTMQDVWMKCPLVVAQGNHDTSANSNLSYHFNTDTTYNDRAQVATAMDGTVYSFVRGDVLFMVINYEDWKKEGYFESLAAWMREQVNVHKDVKWRVATYHKNMFTGSGSHQDDADGKAVRNAMLPVFDELGINIALQGHDHIYEVIGPVNNRAKTLIADEVEMVETVGDGGMRENMTGKQGGVFDVSNGTLYFLNNSAGRKKYEPRDEAAMIASLDKHEVENYWGLFSGKFGQTGEPTFSRVDVTADEITITTYTVDNAGNATEFDSFKIVKKNKGTNVSAMQGREDVKITFDAATRSVVFVGEAPETLKVFSTEGKLVASVSNASSVSAAGLTNGCYIVKATKGENSYFGKVLVK